MPLEISRRDWLKGIMASAGLAAVGIPIDAVEAAADVLAKPEVRPLSIEFGDLWIRRGGEDFFIGKTSCVSIWREIISYPEIHLDRPWLQSIPTNRVDIDASVLIDEHGLAAVNDALASGDLVDAFFGHRGGSYRVTCASIRSASMEMTTFDLVELSIELSGSNGGFG